MSPDVPSKIWLFIQFNIPNTREVNHEYKPYEGLKSSPEVLTNSWLSTLLDIPNNIKLLVNISLMKDHASSPAFSQFL